MSPWLTTVEAADYLRYTGKNRLISVYRFLKKKGVPTARRGHSVLIARRDLQIALGVGHRKVE